MILPMILASAMVTSSVFAEGNSQFCNGNDILRMSKMQLIEKYGEPKDMGSTATYVATTEQNGDIKTLVEKYETNKTLVFDNFIVELSNNDKATMVICTKRN